MTNREKRTKAAREALVAAVEPFRELGRIYRAVGDTVQRLGKSMSETGRPVDPFQQTLDSSGYELKVQRGQDISPGDLVAIGFDGVLRKWVAGDEGRPFAVPPGSKVNPEKGTLDMPIAFADFRDIEIRALAHLDSIVHGEARGA